MNRHGLVALLEDINVEDIRLDGGDEIHARCPMHEQRTGGREANPRHWSINSRKLVFWCWSCHYKGKLPKLVMDMTGLNLWQALKFIHGYDVKSTPTPTKQEPPVRNVAKELLRLFEHQVQLEGRYRRFRPPPERALSQRRLSPGAADIYGLRWDYANDEWIIPISYWNGVLMGWQRKGRDRPSNYPKGVPKSESLFGLHLMSRSRVMLVESPLDVVYVHGRGGRHRYSAVASYGADVSDSQLELLLRHSPATELVLALDDDPAGLEGTQDILRRGWHRRIPTYLFDYGISAAKDPGEMSVADIEAGLAEARLVPARSPSRARAGARR
jgi:DNA primase